MLNFSNFCLTKLRLIVVCVVVILSFYTNLSAQSKMLASLPFDPKVNGFGFKNYKNDSNRNWKDDIAVDDLIRMFGVKAACKSGTNAGNCVLKAAARQWIEHYLDAMNIGHCEGIAVASLRFTTGMPFKRRKKPSEFQTGIGNPFNLRLEQPIENYVAYYWITQTFDEVVLPTRATAEKGPVEIVKMLVASMVARNDTYLLTMQKYDRGRIFDAHAVVPYAVEDTGTQYKIHVYDNNYPGVVRYVSVNKTGNLQWTYSSGTNPNAKPDYVGDRTTKTLSITATSWREGKCFDASFADDEDRDVGCGIESMLVGQPIFQNASFNAHKRLGDADGEDAEFFLTGEGDMLLDEDGERLGYDPKTNRTYEEISDAIYERLIGGFGIDLPHFSLPYEEEGNPYKITFSGRNLDAESNLDFVFSAPGFTVGFDGIRLDPNETLTAIISRDGEEISFTASRDGETPEIFYSFDPDDDDSASYVTRISGATLQAGKTLNYDFDFEQGKLRLSDNDNDRDEFDIDLVRINVDGSEQIYEQDDFEAGEVDRYEMDFGNWDGEGAMCFRDDEEGDGFADDDCTQELNEDTKSDRETNPVFYKPRPYAYPN